MRFTTFVALLVLTVSCFASDLPAQVQSIESEWAKIYYSHPKHAKITAYQALLNKVDAIAKQHSDSSEIIFWQAVLLSSVAEYQNSYAALKSVEKAKNLLHKAISIDPSTANGSAYVTLATLYAFVPEWPIAFGDTEKAEELFRQALKINPNGIDTNFFYGNYLISQNKIDTANEYYKKALDAPVRKNQLFADNNLKNEIKDAVNNKKIKTGANLKQIFLSLFNAENQ
jgi:tetratricopeptide (TPR) repeat protein